MKRQHTSNRRVYNSGKFTEFVFEITRLAWKRKRNFVYVESGSTDIFSARTFLLSMSFSTSLSAGTGTGTGTARRVRRLEGGNTFGRGNAVKSLYEGKLEIARELLEISALYSAAEIRLLFKSYCARCNLHRNEVVANGKNFIAKAFEPNVFASTDR